VSRPTIHVFTSAADMLTDAGDLNTPAARKSFARAWERAAHRIGVAAKVNVNADGNATHATMARMNQRNLDAGVDLAMVGLLRQAAHACVVTATVPGRWTCAPASVVRSLGRDLHFCPPEPRVRTTCPPEIDDYLGVSTDAAIVEWWRKIKPGSGIGVATVGRWRRARGIPSIEGRGRPARSDLVPVADLLTLPTEELRAVLGVSRQRLFEARRIGVSVKTRTKWSRLLAANVTREES
jgi:hypothetical protein